MNFFKSSPIGVNVEDHFMEAVAGFLSCKICIAPFNYLGIPIGANPRCVETWKPMI